MSKEPYKVEDAEVIETGSMALTNIPQNLSPMEIIDLKIAMMPRIGQLQKASRAAAISCTRANDWRDWSGHLRPEFSAASSIMAMFGVRVTDVMREKKNTSYGYQIVMEASFELPMSGFKLEGIQGSCRSNDDIVATRYEYDEAEGKRVKRDIPSGDVDESTVSKKAYANMIVNGCMSIFGLRNVTAEELLAVGIDLGKGGNAKVQHSSAAWEIKEAQTGLLRKFFATDAEISGCKSNGDITTLLNKLKAEKRKAVPGGPPAGAASEPTGDNPPAGGPEDDKAAGIINNLHELADALGFTDEARAAKIADAKAKGLPGLKSLQQSWAELCKAARK